MASPSPEPHDRPDLDLPKAKKPRTTTACNRCRRKRGRCDGQKPTCTPCQQAGAACEYELGGDKRKPYTKAVVQAMQLRIDTLEAQLAALNGGGAVPSTSASAGFNPPGAVAPPGGESAASSPALFSLNVDPSLQQGNGNGGGPSPGGAGANGGGGGAKVHLPTSMSFAEGSAPQVNPNPSNLDTFQGGLAVNAHGELRFYGPTSSYRAVLADSTSLLNTPTTVNAIRAFSLTRAPIPTAAPADPALPRRPPDLSPDFKAKLFGLAFEYCFAHYNIVPERAFYADLQMHP
ncbi:hypothetical protein JCM6882_001366, partial [Rhodosporidiobolus microsporus]